MARNKTARNIIGKQLRRIRSERNLSQPGLAVLLQKRGLDFGRDIIARIESGVRWVGDFELMLIADALDVPVSELLPSRRDWETVQKNFKR